MDQSVQRLLSDKLYDKRKQGALELEKLIRDALAGREYERIQKVVEQLCHDYAYAVHQPHARNGGLIGLAAASIALGSDEVARYLQEIVPPVLACFTDQDARVRYYACEAMYNIAKVAKGEILLFFNEIFDALCKLSADSELSVKNGAELLDRLVKDIVSESAATYVSILNFNEKEVSDSPQFKAEHDSLDLPTAFSLAKFIPLLEERIHVINPFTRTFLVSWLTLLDTIPDLELVYYLPAFLGGVFKFLGDPNRDVYVATQGLLERFLNEIKNIAKIKRGLAESRKTAERRKQHNNSSPRGSQQGSMATGDETSDDRAIQSSSDSAEDADGNNNDGDWIPGQDVQVDHAKILDILLKFVDVSSTRDSAPLLRLEGLSQQKQEEIGIVALRWIDSFFDVSPEDILPFVPRLLSQVLPALSAQSETVRSTASRVNRSLMDYIVTLQDGMNADEKAMPPSSSLPTRNTEAAERKPNKSTTTSSPAPSQPDTLVDAPETPQDLTPRSSAAPTPQPPTPTDLDYAAAVNELTLQFLNEHEATRVAALSWLLMLHRKAPKKVLAYNDGTFPALLKTLSDTSESVVTRDLQLLSQISKNSDESYFRSFMVNLLQLFSTDRRLLEVRGNLIIRQLCVNLMPERIYRTLAECLERDEDVEFASIMVQNLNNNLITAPELAELRKRLRNLDSHNKEGQAFFVGLFRAWCYNAVATFSLCLLGQMYEQAYGLLGVIGEGEMTVGLLIQIDKLVQLLESPVFTYLRLQLLEPERYPYLYKCLYGLLMLLPQSSAFAALKNRLNSVSAIGLLHGPSTTTPAGSRGSVVAGMPGTSSISGAGSGTASAGIPGRLGRSRDTGSGGTGGGSGDKGEIKWSELLEKFRGTQEKARRRNQTLLRSQYGGEAENDDDTDSRQDDGSQDTLAGRQSLRPTPAGRSGGNTVITTGGGGGGQSFSLRQGNGSGGSLQSQQQQRPGSAQSGMLGRSGSGFGYTGAAGGRSGGMDYAQSTGIASAGNNATSGTSASQQQQQHGHKSRHSLAGNLGRFASGIRGNGRDSPKDNKRDGRDGAARR